MKQLLFGLLFIGMAGLLSAQTGTPEEKAVEKAGLFSQKYQLSNAQQEKMYKIQLRRYRDRELIAPNKTADPALYLEQIKAIENGADVSVQLILTEAQMPMYKAYVLERRKMRAEAAQTMLKQGTPIQQVETSIMELE